MDVIKHKETVMELEKYRQVIKDAIQSEIDARQFYEQVSGRIRMIT